MADSPSSSDPDNERAAPSEADGTDGDVSEEELRRRVEEKYDFDDFGPGDMAEMSVEEWEAAFDEATWITGDELVDRVRADLERRIAYREVFAVLEEVQLDGQRCLLAYSDEDYALVRPDGSVEGFGTVLRDVKPTVALCSMEGYEVEEPPEDAVLPTPGEVPEGSGELGNLMLQVVAAVQAVAGVGLLVAAVLAPPATGGATTVQGPDIGRVLMVVGGLGFVVVSAVLFFTVANARLSDRFRAEEYRDRLRAVGLEEGERPDFLPLPDDGERAEND